MYGLVNKALHEMVVSRHGEEIWHEIRTRAGVADPSFVGMRSYPDDVTYRLVGAASEVLATPADRLLTAFGEHWMAFTAQQGYGPILRLAGGNVIEFLANLNALHDRLRSAFPDLKPPRIMCSEVGADSLRVHYYSERAGLVPFVVGLLHGVGRMFDTRVEVRHDRARGPDHDHDEFLVRILSGAVS